MKNTIKNQHIFTRKKKQKTTYCWYIPPPAPPNTYKLSKLMFSRDSRQLAYILTTSRKKNDTVEFVLNPPTPLGK